MPNRMIRDGLLDSEAVLSLPSEVRWLFVTILLSADDVGLFEAAPFRLSRRADIRREVVEKYVQMLVDADLIRLYQAAGRPLGFVPKFGQRMQITKMKYPAPPPALLAGDEDALSKINRLSLQTAVGHRRSTVDERLSTVGKPPESETEAEGEENNIALSQARGYKTLSRCPHADIVDAYHRLLPACPRVVEWTERRQKLLGARWREQPKRQHLAWWESFFAYVARSDFLCGRVEPVAGRQQFIADLEWLLNSSNIVKVIEGKYLREHV